MRLIDADKLYDSVDDLPRDYGRFDDSEVLDAIKYAPTIDAIPVRCKDCKYLGIKDLGTGYCKGKMCGIVRPDSYCSYGERREGKE